MMKRFKTYICQSSLPIKKITAGYFAFAGVDLISFIKEDSILSVQKIN
jgi:hypothetical protein